MNALSLANRNLAPLGNGRIPRREISPFADFHREMDQLLDDTFTGFGFTRHRRPMPAIEVRETEKEYFVSVDLPGVAMKDIELTFSEGMLRPCRNLLPIVCRGEYRSSNALTKTGRALRERGPPRAQLRRARQLKAID